MKEKMLITLERDRVVGILASMPIPGDEPVESPEAPRPKSAQKAKAKPTSAKSEAASEPAQLSPSVSSGPDRDQGEVATRKHDTPFPIDRRINPQLDVLGKSNLVNRLTSVRAWVGNRGGFIVGNPHITKKIPIRDFYQKVWDPNPEKSPGFSKIPGILGIPKKIGKNPGNPENQCPGLGLELGIHFQNLVFGIYFQYLGFGLGIFVFYDYPGNPRR